MLRVKLDEAYYRAYGRLPLGHQRGCVLGLPLLPPLPPLLHLPTTSFSKQNRCGRAKAEKSVTNENTEM